MMLRALKTTNKTDSPEIRNRTRKADFPRSKVGRVGGKKGLVETTTSKSELEKIFWSEGRELQSRKANFYLCYQVLRFKSPRETGLVPGRMFGRTGAE